MLSKKNVCNLGKLQKKFLSGLKKEFQRLLFGFSVKYCGQYLSQSKSTSIFNMSPVCLAFIDREVNLFRIWIQPNNIMIILCSNICWFSYPKILHIYIHIYNFLGFIWEKAFFFFLWQFNVFSWPFNKFEKLWNYLSSDTKPISRAPWHRKFQKKFTNYCCWDPGWMWEFWTK